MTKILSIRLAYFAVFFVLMFILAGCGELNGSASGDAALLGSENDLEVQSSHTFTLSGSGISASGEISSTESSTEKTFIEFSKGILITNEVSGADPKALYAARNYVPVMTTNYRGDQMTNYFDRAQLIEYIDTYGGGPILYYEDLVWRMDPVFVKPFYHAEPFDYCGLAVVGDFPERFSDLSENRSSESSGHDERDYVFYLIDTEGSCVAGPFDELYRTGEMFVAFSESKCLLLDSNGAVYDDITEKIIVDGEVSFEIFEGVIYSKTTEFAYDTIAKREIDYEYFFDILTTNYISAGRDASASDVGVQDSDYYKTVEKIYVGGGSSDESVHLSYPLGGGYFAHTLVGSLSVDAFRKSAGNYHFADTFPKEIASCTDGVYKSLTEPQYYYIERAYGNVFYVFDGDEYYFYDVSAGKRALPHSRLKGSQIIYSYDGLLIARNFGFNSAFITDRSFVEFSTAMYVGHAAVVYPIERSYYFWMYIYPQIEYPDKSVQDKINEALTPARLPESYDISEMTDGGIFQSVLISSFDIAEHSDYLTVIKYDSEFFFSDRESGFDAEVEVFDLRTGEGAKLSDWIMTDEESLRRLEVVLIDAVELQRVFDGYEAIVEYSVDNALDGKIFPSEDGFKVVFVPVENKAYEVIEVIVPYEDLRGIMLEDAYRRLTE